jgi:hypothetical protein
VRFWPIIESVTESTRRRIASPSARHQPSAECSWRAYFIAEDAKDAKDAYNTREPADDWDNYGAPWSAVLQHGT